jgi:hypothetical protein
MLPSLRAMSKLKSREDKRAVLKHTCEQRLPSIQQMRKKNVLGEYVVFYAGRGQSNNCKKEGK